VTICKNIGSIVMTQSSTTTKKDHLRLLANKTF